MFSPAVVILTLGVYYFGQSSDRVQALFIPLYVCTSYVAAALLVTFGGMPDRSLFSAQSMPLSSHLLGMGAVTLILALTARMAQVSRTSMRVAIQRAQDAMLAARKGEALLAEAQQQLDRAIGVAVGKPSHSTGQLAGSYRLGLIVGIGAMGEVYEAEHEQTGELAAVKLLRPNALSRADLVERFLREGAICIELKHPHLVQVYSVGKLQDGAPYLAMELPRGSDLATRLRKQGSLSLPEVLELSSALADALTRVHDAGVVHRDLKPVNVFYADSPTGRPLWKVLDFGVSKLRSSTDTLTDVGVVGTPGYMSPEQARGLPVDHRSDIFAMATLLYRTLTGRPAFTGNDTPQIMFEVVYKMPERPSSILKQLPPDVDLVFAIALAKDPKQRWSSVQELADALEVAVSRRLGTELRHRAHTILRSSPWGEPLNGSDDASADRNVG